MSARVAHFLPQLREEVSVEEMKVSCSLLVEDVIRDDLYVEVDRGVVQKDRRTQPEHIRGLHFHVVKGHEVLPNISQVQVEVLPKVLDAVFCVYRVEAFEDIGVVYLVKASLR